MELLGGISLDGIGSPLTVSLLGIMFITFLLIQFNSPAITRTLVRNITSLNIDRVFMRYDCDLSSCTDDAFSHFLAQLVSLLQLYSLCSDTDSCDPATTIYLAVLRCKLGLPMLARIMLLPEESSLTLRGIEMKIGLSHHSKTCSLQGWEPQGLARARSSTLQLKTMRKSQTWLDSVGKSPVSLTNLTSTATAVIPTSYQPYFSAYMPLAPMYCVNVDICGTHDFNDANMSNTDQYNFPEHHISLNSTADDFDTHFDYTMSHPGTLAALDTLVYPFYHKHAEAIDPNHEEAGPRGLGMWHFRCSDEDDMSSGSSIDAESLFDYSPSESEATSTVGSSAVQQELTYTNIEHMLTVLKAERGKCLGELRGLDAALETIDQLANRKRPGSRGGNARII